MLFIRVNLIYFKKFGFESFQILITVNCKGRVIKLCKIEIVFFLFVFGHKSKIRSIFFCGSGASPRLKIKRKRLS